MKEMRSKIHLMENDIYAVKKAVRNRYIIHRSILLVSKTEEEQNEQNNVKQSH